VWEWISLVTWVIQEISLSRNTTLCVAPIPEEWFFQPPSSFSFFIILNLHCLIPLEHHRYHLHSPSIHMQTLNQIPSTQPSINSPLSLSLSIPFSKFHTSKKKRRKTFEDSSSTLVQMGLHQFCFHSTRRWILDSPRVLEDIHHRWIWRISDQ